MNRSDTPIGKQFIVLPTPSFPHFLPSPFLLCNPTDLIWEDDWSHSHFIRRSASWGFFGVFLIFKVNARRSVHSPQDHIIIILIISNRGDWRKTLGKVPLAWNPDRSWWHRHTSLKLSLAAAHGSMDKRYFLMQRERKLGLRTHCDVKWISNPIHDYYLPLEALIRELELQMAEIRRIVPRAKGTSSAN